MSLFVVWAALMTGLAVVLVAWPLLRARAADGQMALVPALAVALSIPLAAAGLYHVWSHWSWDPADLAAGNGQLTVEQMMTRLEHKLERDPNDVAGWMLLGRSREVMNRYEQAVAAFEQAYKVSGGRNAEATASLGEALALVDAKAMEGRAATLFEEALREDPLNPKALWYGGLVALHRGDLAVARDRWASLLKLGPPAELASLLAKRIAELDAKLGRPPDTALAALAAPAAAPSASPEPGAGSAAVRVHVSLAPALNDQRRSTDTLFVLARDPRAPGPPLAVKRFPPGQSLPVDVELTPADAMVASRSLAGVREAMIVARLSRTGQPLPASGDLYGELHYDLAAGRSADLIIDRTVP